MINAFKGIFFIFIFLVLSLKIFATDQNFDTLPFEDRIYLDNIKSLRAYYDDGNNNEFSYPLIELFSGQQILFSFDQIESSPEVYYYTIFHCTYDWKKSNLLFFEFADGFEENEIQNYEDSRSTLVSYTHYNLHLPNDELNLKKSGNYLLLVYKKADDKNIIVFTKRFMVFETLIDVEANLSLVANGMYRKTSQKLDFSINYSKYELFDPSTEILPVILQNYQWNNALYNLKPSFLDNQKIIYNWEEKTMFMASNEYRTFDIINLEFEGENVKNIEFRKPYYFVELQSDESNFSKQYSKIIDFNGRYGIRTKRYKSNDIPELQADYVIVKFSLYYPMPIHNTDVYLYGELTNFENTEKYKMDFNPETRSYEKLLFLKQGYYNYRYLTLNTKTNLIDHCFFEGSFYDTENDYLLLIYHRSPRKSYDQLIYYGLYNTTSNNLKN